jgi:hypothetical protein
MSGLTFEKWWEENYWRFCGEVTSQHVKIAWDAALGMLLVVEGDYNDADYIVSVAPVTEEKLEKFLPLIEAIKNFKPYTITSRGYAGEGEKPLSWTHKHNWPCGEYGCRQDLGEKPITELYPEIDAGIVEEFDQEYVPHNEDGNVHTIEKIFTVRFDRLIFEHAGK